MKFFGNVNEFLDKAKSIEIEYDKCLEFEYDENQVIKYYPLTKLCFLIYIDPLSGEYNEKALELYKGINKGFNETTLDPIVIGNIKEIIEKEERNERNNKSND